MTRSGLLTSDRGHLLFYDGIGDTPVLTVENCCKWYGLYVIRPSLEVVKFECDRDDEQEFYKLYKETAYGDHVFNPRFVVFLARRYGYELPACALEVLIGRWRLECLNEDYTVPITRS